MTSEQFNGPHKRFLAFVYQTYYPVGGIEDLEDSFDELSGAIDCVLNSKLGVDVWEGVEDDSRKHGHVYDRISGTVVYDTEPEEEKGHFSYDEIKD